MFHKYTFKFLREEENRVLFRGFNRLFFKDNLLVPCSLPGIPRKNQANRSVFFFELPLIWIAVKTKNAHYILNTLYFKIERAVQLLPRHSEQKDHCRAFLGAMTFLREILLIKQVIISF